MKRSIYLLFTLWLLVIFTACSSEHNKQAYKTPLTISTNVWIGYAPLFYAKEKGYLKSLNIKLAINISLAEAAEVYLMGNADIVTTTQHEYHDLKKIIPETVPFMLIDRSNGADMILSNKSISEIKQAKHIDAYLEIDSINTDLLQDFMRQYGLREENFHFVNKDQSQLSNLKPDATQNMLLVTYSPYDTILKKAGFQLLGSTINLEELIVVDALCTRKQTLEKEKERLRKFKKIIDCTIDEMMQDKKKGYEMVKGYLNHIDYRAYIEALKGIKWINHPSERLLRKIEPMGYKKEYLIP